MKYYALLFGFGFLITSCGTGKEIVEDKTTDVENTAETVEEEVEETKEVMEGEMDQNYRIMGMVHVDDGECPIWIEARGKDGLLKIYPIGLDDKYKKEGMKIKFAYTKSMAQQPEGCDIDLVAVLSDVTLMR